MGAKLYTKNLSKYCKTPERIELIEKKMGLKKKILVKKIDSLICSLEKPGAINFKIWGVKIHKRIEMIKREIREKLRILFANKKALFLSFSNSFENIGRKAAEIPPATKIPCNKSGILNAAK